MNLPRKRLFWSVAFAHMTNDIFMSMGPVLLAFLKISVMPGMTNTEIGFAIGIQQLMGAASQPFFGLLSDRYGGRMIGSVGVAWSVLFTLLAVMAAAVTGQYWLMFFPFVLSAVGSGAFHPVGTHYAGESELEKEASNMAYFFLFGQLGLALGPALVGFLLDRANPTPVFFQTLPVVPVFNAARDNLTPIFFIGLLGIPAVLLMFTSMPRRRKQAQATQGDSQHASSSGNGLSEFFASLPAKPLLILATLVMLRGLAQPGSVTFIPVLFQGKGWDPTEFGLITSFFWIGSGVAGVIFGNLADRYDRRYVIAVSLLLSAPAFFLLPLVDGRLLAFVLAIAAGGLSGGSHSVIVVLAQSLIPSAKGFASGATLGFIFGTGALGSLIIGGLSDAIGLGAAFQVAAATTVVASLIALALPAGKARPSAETVDAQAEIAPTPAK